MSPLGALPEPEPIGPGQESVWDYPRPAICEPTDRRIEVIHGHSQLADSRAAWRTLETSHPPTYYIPRSDIMMDCLTPNPRRSLCEWKGQAHYFDVVLGDVRLEAAAWTYSDPTEAFAGIRGYCAFYPGLFERCLVDGQQVTAQPGGFYGGWISPYESGPFKGVPGSRYW